ncbi:MAG: RES domain-containing protein [Acidobacteriaceae bacterium]|nr:RES domain-containing protein [Acidobacteriaceae bacterium]
MTLFRIGSSRYPANDGRGASLYGGRWNRKGTAVIYTAESRALCALEVMANAAELANDYVVTEIDIPQETPITNVSIDELPPGWDAAEPTDLTRNLGTN